MKKPSLAFYAGLIVLVAAEILDPPVALAIAIGHLLHDVTREGEPLNELAQALEEA